MWVSVPLWQSRICFYQCGFFCLQFLFTLLLCFLCTLGLFLNITNHNNQKPMQNLVCMLILNNRTISSPLSHFKKQLYATGLASLLLWCNRRGAWSSERLSNLIQMTSMWWSKTQTGSFVHRSYSHFLDSCCSLGSLHFLHSSVSSSSVPCPPWLSCPSK